MSGTTSSRTDARATLWGFTRHRRAMKVATRFFTPTFLLIGLAGNVQASDQKTPFGSACGLAARELFKEAPTRIAGRINEPKKLNHVAPKYPKLPPGTIGSGVWVGDALVGPDGRVHRVSVFRDLTFNPPAPEFSAAIVDAIRQWTYTPTLVGGRAVPICITVTVSIHVR